MERLTGNLIGYLKRQAMDLVQKKIFTVKDFGLFSWILCSYCAFIYLKI